jgi:hypothetical protein
MKKKKQDLTVIMSTANRVPKEWAKFHKKILLEAIGNTPLITLSFEPLDFGENLIQEKYGVIHYYKELLRAARLAKTKYIAIAEDDVLYPEEHFDLRPPKSKLGYDMNRWVINTWGETIFYHKPHPANCGLVCERELFMEAWEERFGKFGDDLPRRLLKEVGRNRYERRYGVREIPTSKMYPLVPYLCFAHVKSVDPGQKYKKKRVWPVRAYEIPKWGRAEDIVRKFV